LEGLAREEPDLGVIAPVEDAELAGAGHLVAETHAAGAEDAALRVQHDVGPERPRLRLVDLLVGHARVVEPVPHVVDLQPALAGLVTYGAVQWMIDEVDLHDRLAGREHALGLRVHDHPVGGLGVAADLGPRVLLDIHHAEPALPRDAEPGVIAVVRHLDPGLAGGLDEVGARRDLHFLAVYGQLGHRGIRPRAGSGPRTRPGTSRC